MQFPPTEDVSDLSYTSAAVKKMKGIVFAHLNICSLIRKLDNVKILLKNSDMDFLFLSETFLNTSIDDIELAIPGYNLLRADRSGRTDKKGGGGLILYYADCYELCNTSSICSNSLETLWATLKLPKARPIELCGFYRPPDAKYDQSLTEFENQCTARELSLSHDIVFLGDCNIDYMSRSTAKTRLVNFLKSMNLDQVIKHPTRITNNSATCIDHIFVNNHALFAHRGTLSPGLSNHDLTFIVRKRAKNRKAKVTIRIRCYRHFDQDSFSRDINQTDWSVVTTATDLDTAASCFNIIFGALVDKHMPWKKIRVRANNAPWISNEYLSLVDAHEYHAREYRKCPCEFHLNRKLDSKTTAHRVKNRLKREYVKTSLNRYKNDSKKLWKEIRQFWPSNKNTKVKVGEVGGMTTSSAKAEFLNNYFSMVGQNLSADIPVATSDDIETCTLTYRPPVFELAEINIDDVKPSVAHDLDELRRSIDCFTSSILISANSNTGGR